MLYRLDHLIPPDSRVEIDAKIAAGYFSSGKQVTGGFGEDCWQDLGGDRALGRVHFLWLASLDLWVLLYDRADDYSVSTNGLS